MCFRSTVQIYTDVACANFRNSQKILKWNFEHFLPISLLSTSPICVFIAQETDTLNAYLTFQEEREYYLRISYSKPFLLFFWGGPQQYRISVQMELRRSLLICLNAITCKLETFHAESARKDLTDINTSCGQM